MTSTVRDLHFDFETDVPRHWHGGRKSVTTFFDNLSVFFPLGERFFVASVRAYQSQIEDPALLRETRAFCAQEGIHSREHDQYNALLVRQGYPVEEMERGVEAILTRVKRRAPREMRLAVTCALEHFTALMGQLLLGNPGLLEGAHPAMRALWRWHAAEENEHKSVAFDVYRAIGGGYVRRVVAMVGATVIFWTKVFEHQVRLMRVDRTALSPTEWWAVFWFLFVEPGGMFSVVRHYFDYFRPGFHPSDIDSRAALDAWRDDFERGQASRI